MFQAVELVLKLRNYGKRKPFWTLKWEGCFADRTVTEDLADGTAQKQQQTWECQAQFTSGMKVYKMNSEMCRLME